MGRIIYYEEETDLDEKLDPKAELKLKEFKKWNKGWL